MTIPEFFIAGAPKCGTTALWNFLRLHSDIFMPDKIKEPGFFIKTLPPFGGIRKKMLFRDMAVDPDDVRLDWTWYTSLFQEAGPNQKIGEASTAYFFRTEACALIKKYKPDAKIIIMLRDPVERTYSSYKYLSRHAPPKHLFPDFNDMVGQDHWILQNLIFISQYKQHLQRFFSHFPKEQVLIVLLKDLKSDMKSCTNRICDFLGLTKEDLSSAQRQYNQHYEPIFARFTWMSRHFRHLLRQNKLPVEIHKMMIRSKHKITPLFRTFQKKANSKKINPTIRKKLIPYFKKDVSYVENLLGRDLSHWRE